jgi:hypothetical protein
MAERTRAGDEFKPELYNAGRRHSAWGRRAPDAVYFNRADSSMAACKPRKISLKVPSSFRGSLLSRTTAGFINLPHRPIVRGVDKLYSAD